MVNGKGYGSFSTDQDDCDSDDEDYDDELNPPVQKQTCQIEIIRIKAGKSYRFHFISGTVMTFNTFAMYYDKARTENAPMKVIEVDGAYTEPYATDRVHVGSGQRYSVLMPVVSVDSYRASVKVGKQPGFWLEGRETGRPNDSRGPTLVWVQLEDPDDQSEIPAQVPLNGMVRDIRGNKKPVVDDDDDDDDDDDEKQDRRKLKKLFSTSFVSQTGIEFDKATNVDLPLKSLHSVASSAEFPKKATATIKITSEDVSVERGGRTQIEWRQNDLAYFGPKDGIPRLLAMATQRKNQSPNPAAYISDSHFDKTNELYAFKKGDVIDIILQNQAVNTFVNVPEMQSGSDYEYSDDEMEFDKREAAEYYPSDGHPFHLHGAHYFDLGAGPGVYSEDVVARNIKNNEVLKRDTSMLYKYKSSDDYDISKPYLNGWRAVRIRVESMGVWPFHCHSKSDYNISAACERC